MHAAGTLQRDFPREHKRYHSAKSDCCRLRGHAFYLGMAVALNASTSEGRLCRYLVFPNRVNGFTGSFWSLNDASARSNWEHVVFWDDVMSATEDAGA